MEDKIKQIIGDLISQIDGDWALFMNDKAYEEYVSTYTEKIINALKGDE